MFMQHHNDTTIKTQEGKRKKTSLEKYSPLTLLQGFGRVVERFACSRVLETEHKLHILTPLLWPSRCVFLVLLDVQPEVLGSTPSGLSEGPLGLVWPSLPHLVSNPLGVCWQLHQGFPRSPSVGCGLPYHIWSLLSGSRLATASGVFRVPPRSGVAFPTTSGLYCLEFDWQLLWDPNSTELNNNSTPTRSPTGSLKSNV